MKEEFSEVKRIEYLRSLSQSVYNLIQIIKTHCKNPVEIDKELMRFFKIERTKLKNLLSKRIIGARFRFDEGILKIKLLSNYNETSQRKLKSEETEGKLCDLLAEIEEKRDGSVTTGIEEGLLKDHIDLINEKKDRLVDEKILRRQKAPEINMIDEKRQDKGNIPKFPYKLPRGTKWENFVIKFLDEKRVWINVKQFEHEADYKEMGFIGKGKDPKPSVAWAFLKVLAKLGGEITIRDPEAQDKYKTQKRILSQLLENYFTIEYDPFYPYRQFIKSFKKNNSFKIKITLIPLLEKETKKTIEIKTDDPLGIKEYLEERCPQIVENKR